MTTFFVPGAPATQGSKSLYRGRMVESSKKLPAWRKAVAAVATVHRSRDAALFPDQALAVDLEFVVQRPKYAIGKLLPAVKRSTGDIDKLARAVLDGLTGICYRDDSQVTTLTVHKRLAAPGEATGVHITYQLDTAHLEQDTDAGQPRAPQQDRRDRRQLLARRARVRRHEPAAGL